MVHPCFPGGWISSACGEYELGKSTWVYEEAIVDEDLFDFSLGTGLGAVDVVVDRLEDCFQPEALDDSSSEPLSQASSSPQSEVE